MIVALIAAATWLLLRDRGPEPGAPRSERPPVPAGVRLVELDLARGFRIEPMMAENRSEGDLFPEMVTRLKPHAAINGTFYDENKRPLGDVVIGGRLVNRGHYRNAIAVTDDGRVEFRRIDRGRFDWRGYKAGLAAGPRLVHRGQIACDPVADGFGAASTTLEATRSGVGLTADNRLLLVTVTRRVTLAEFADIMLDLGAVEALNLDGGGACGLYHDGEILTLPALPMANLLVVYGE